MALLRTILSVLLALIALGSPWSEAAMSIYLSPEQLAAVAPLVVEGTVARVASGYDPVTGSLATYVTIDITTVRRGPASLARIVLRQPGGSYGSLALEVDAVPVFRAGERVFLFAEPGRDGVLRAAGMFFGKYTILEDEAGKRRALRDLTGRGLILRRPPEVLEEMPLDELALVVEAQPLKARPEGVTSWKEAPPEMERILWAEEAAKNAEFVPLSTAAPARWEESDVSTPITVDIERARSPIADPVATVTEITRAMAVWTSVPEARVVLRPGNDNVRFTLMNRASPADAYPPSNIVLFGDPYDDLSDPVGCSGTLAIGGYWRSTTAGKTVNNLRFYPARRLYVIFNRRFECFLADPRNLAEIATHELGHGLGFGHSDAQDASMRSFAYGNRGAVLGADDRDAVHCTYPHTLRVLSPNGSETLAAGSMHAITWSSTAESGPDAGSVDLELSTDDGMSFAPIALGVPNDGSHAWSVPRAVLSRARVRVLHPNQTSPSPLPFPPACSEDVSDASFSIDAGGLPAGRVTDGGGGDPLRIDRGAAGLLELRWGASCGAPGAYAVYEGTLAALRARAWDHAPLTCSAGLSKRQTVSPGEGDRYYLVSAVQGAREGPLGKGSSGIERPAARATCGTRETLACPAP